MSEGETPMTKFEKPTCPLTQVEFDEEDFDVAERIARRLGYTQTAYTSSSSLWGLYCLPDRATQRKGCVIKTKELGLMFVQDLEDLLMHEEAQAQYASWKTESRKAKKMRNQRP